MLLGLPLYGYVSKSAKTRLVGQNARTSARIAGDGLQAALTLAAGQDAASDGEGNFLDYAHDRTQGRLDAAATTKDAQIVLNAGLNVGTQPRGAIATAAATAASGDLSSKHGQQIAFNEILKLGALAKSGSNYVGANGYTRG